MACVSSACSGLCKLSLRHVDHCGWVTVNKSRLSIHPLTQLTHLTLDRVHVNGNAAKQSLGQLARGLPALQQLEVRRRRAAITYYPLLLQRITSIKDCLSGLLLGVDLLPQLARCLQRLHIFCFSGSMPFATFSALCACPSLTHVVVGCLLPPPDGSMGTLVSLPLALQQLTFTDRMQPGDLIKLPWIHK